MTPEQQKEELSKAYIHAVAARCGFAVGSWSQDHGGIDATIGAAGPMVASGLSRPKIDIQLKCTSRTDVLKTDHLVWTLQREHYENLRHPAIQPHLLVVLLLPEQESEWVKHTPDMLILRRCAWYVKMTGMAPVPAGNATVTVKLPLTNEFSPAQLHAMMVQLSQTGTL